MKLFIKKKKNPKLIINSDVLRKSIPLVIKKSVVNSIYIKTGKDKR